MSAASKVTFSLACMASAGIIFWVHYKQMEDRNRMHQGVLRDLNALEMKRRQNLQDLANQQALKTLLQEQERKETQGL